MSSFRDARVRAARLVADGNSTLLDGSSLSGWSEEGRDTSGVRANPLYERSLRHKLESNFALEIRLFEEFVPAGQ